MGIKREIEKSLASKQPELSTAIPSHVFEERARIEQLERDVAGMKKEERARIEQLERDVAGMKKELGDVQTHSMKREIEKSLASKQLELSTAIPSHVFEERARMEQLERDVAGMKKELGDVQTQLG